VLERCEQLFQIDADEIVSKMWKSGAQGANRIDPRRAASREKTGDERDGH
jgi:hypothetical protein